MHAQRRNHRDVTCIQRGSDGGGVHFLNLADVAQFRVGYAAGQHTVVYAAEADAPAAQLLQQRHQFLVNQTAQHRHDDFQALGVGDAQPADEVRRYALALHPSGYDVAAAVHHDDLGSFSLQLDEVEQGGVVAAQGAAADFHYNGQGKSPAAKDLTHKGKETSEKSESVRLSVVSASSWCNSSLRFRWCKRC